MIPYPLFPMGWTSHGGPVFYLRPAKINSAGLRRLRGGVLCTLVIGSASAQKQIHILDSESASAGELRLALYLKELIDAGEDFDTVVEKSTRFMESMRTLFVLEDLGNLVKNGRLNKVSGIVASVLSLCPIMSDDGHGEIRMAAKARGMKQALMKLTSLIAQETAGAAPRSLTLTMAYCNCPERAGLLRGGILESCPAGPQAVQV